MKINLMKNNKKIKLHIFAIAFFFSFFSFSNYSFATTLDLEPYWGVQNYTLQTATVGSSTITTSSGSCTNRIINGGIFTGYLYSGTLVTTLTPGDCLTNDISSLANGEYLFSGSGGANPYVFFTVTNNLISYGGSTPESYINYSVSTTTSITLNSDSSTHIGNPILITGTYTNNGTYDQILWNIQNLTIGQTISTATSSTSWQNGTFSISKNLWLNYNGNYSAQAILYDSSTGSTTNSNTIYFGLNSTTSTTQILLDSASTSNEFLNGFLNVPSLLQTKKPFAYFIQMGTALTNAIATTSTTEIPTGTISYKIGNLATSSIDMFSSSTIKYFFTQTYIDLFRGLEVATIWFGLGWFLYHDAKKKKLF